MSRKNQPFEKKIRTLTRALRKGRTAARIDLVQWLEDHKHADTAGQALGLIYDGRVTSESHVIRARYVPASLRPTLQVKVGERVSSG